MLLIWTSMAQVAAATVVFAAIHSGLASLKAKHAAVRWFGERNRNGLYRVFFIAQSLLLFGLLSAFIFSRPDYELYRAKPPMLWLIVFAQFGAGLYTLAAVRQVGFFSILGLKSFWSWIHGAETLAEPEAQGPSLTSDGLKRKLGPFAWSRHPLNFGPLLILWLWPTMTTNLFAFNATTTIYLLIGSLHEEARLRAVYGEKYAAYQNSGVPFYFPWPNRRVAPAAGSKAETITSIGLRDLK